MIIDFPTVATGTPADEPFKLEMHICDQRRSYIVEFYRECDVIAFIRRREEANETLRANGVFGGGYAWFPVEESPIPEQWDALYHLLFPMCEHRMSADLCWGPNHYPTADEERARGW